jgi:hypothetical protein
MEATKSTTVSYFSIQKRIQLLQFYLITSDCTTVVNLDQTLLRQTRSRKERARFAAINHKPLCLGS